MSSGSRSITNVLFLFGQKIPYYSLVERTSQKYFKEEKTCR